MAIRRSVTPLSLLLSLVVLLLASHDLTAAAAGPYFTQNALSVQVSGTSGSAYASISANPSTTVAAYGLCTKDAAGRDVAFGSKPGATILSTGTTIRRTATFAPGSYTTVPCVRYAGRWRAVGSRTSFTVGGTDVSPSSPSPSPTASASPTTSAMRNLPGQPALTAYGSSSAATAYAHAGALVIAGRDQYGEQAFKDVSAAGGTVLLYMDPVIDASYGRYHQLLDTVSSCGGATQRWPGNYSANQWGYLNDFRPGSAVQAKFRCVLETMVAENPHMGGFFLDDVGSRSWYPGFSWDSFGTANQQAYRDGAIALVRTAHDVAVEHSLMVMVNGSWGAGSLVGDGGGYPDMSKNGISFADGGYIEHHSASELSYWTAYAQGQWGTATGSVSHGMPFMYVQASDAATRDAYARTGVFAYLSAQVDYDTASVWASFHATGLPTRTS